MYRYLVVVEKAGGNYSAYSPDIPGCVATGPTSEEAKRNMVAAINMHLEGLSADGVAIPKPDASADYVAVNWAGG
jgi:predicted RNase H-like HicB family nuclease